jgi:3-oxoadipate enol-lactonase
VQIESQVEDLGSFLSCLGEYDEKYQSPLVDIVGFSFGGRVAMAFASTYPQSVHKLVLTSVGSDRGSIGRLIFQQWRQLLDTQNRHDSSLESFAWASILSTYHPSFLAANESRVSKWVELLVQNNTVEGIASIVTQTFNHDSLAVAKKCNEFGVKGLVVCGSQDALITYEGVVKLAQEANFEHVVFSECAHAIPFESPIKWRNQVMEFLNKK